MRNFDPLPLALQFRSPQITYPSVCTIGEGVADNNDVGIGISERQGGLYILGKPIFLITLLLQRHTIFLGRWSGTGLFPRIGEMIADTVEHLQKGKALLSTVSDRLVWYKTGYRVNLENVVIGPHLRPVESYQVSKFRAQSGKRRNGEDKTTPL